MTFWIIYTIAAIIVAIGAFFDKDSDLMIALAIFIPILNAVYAMNYCFMFLFYLLSRNRCRYHE